MSSDAWAEEIASAHPAPAIPGLQITEKDPRLVVLYEELQKSQLSLASLEALSADDLYWLAGHLERPPNMDPKRWRKLRANAWRARRVLEKQSQDRSFMLQKAFQKDQNERNRKTQVVCVAIAGVATLLGVLIGRFSQPTGANPIKVQIQYPASPTVQPSSAPR